MVCFGARLAPPSWELPFGADASGRDLLARVAHGTLGTLIPSVGIVFLAIFVGSVFVLYFVTTGSAVTALYEIMAGGLFLGAIFMATDYQTSPINNKGKAFFALGCGILTFVIREYCAYPEGVSLSILVMNILAPMIEKWTAATPLGLGGPKNAK